MKRDAHQTAAQELEQSIGDLGDPITQPYNRRALIELSWGAAFEWLAYGADRKHSKHKDKHEGLARFLRDVGEGEMADRWTALEGIRQGGFYGHQTDEGHVRGALALLQEIRQWAVS